MLNKYIESLLHEKPLTSQDFRYAVDSLLSPDTNKEQVCAFLILLAKKGETIDEILAVIETMQKHMISLDTHCDTLDIVGTGGDRQNTINISTGAAILAAACGVPIAKHGNRAVSSLSGSADVISALGINIEMPAQQVSQCLQQLNIGFCFAPRFHPALNQLRVTRQRLGLPTIFNIVAPFLNPAKAQHYLLGVYSPTLHELFADILLAMGVKKSAVIHSDGMDEITCTGISQVIEVDHHQKKKYQIDPRDYGFKIHPKETILGKDAQYNAHMLTEALKGEPNALADTLILNAAMAVYLYGLTNDISAAVTLVQKHFLAGSALRLLQQWQLFSQQETQHA